MGAPRIRICPYCHMIQPGNIIEKHHERCAVEQDKSIPISIEDVFEKAVENPIIYTYMTYYQNGQIGMKDALLFIIRDLDIENKRLKKRLTDKLINEPPELTLKVSKEELEKLLKK